MLICLDGATDVLAARVIAWPGAFLAEAGR